MKKIVASLLSVIMLVFACGPVGLAYNFSDGVLTSGTTENDMPTLQAVYMKRNADAPDGTCKFEEDTIGSLKAGDDFYIGLRAKNFSHFSGITKGLYSIAGGIAYSTDYIEPYEYYEDAPSTIINDDSDFFGVLEERMENDTSSSSFYKYKNGRTTYGITGAALSKSSDGYNAEITNAKVVQFGIQFGSIKKTPGPIADDEYVMFIHFRVKATPSDPEKVMAISNATEIGVQFGMPDDMSTFEDYSYSATSQLENYLKLDNSKIDLFPASYDIKFYEDNTYTNVMTSADGSTTFGATGIADGTAYADSGITIPKAGTDFSLINSNNEYFYGFKYVDSTGTEQSLDDLSTIDANAVAKGYSDSVIRVYPKYDVGKTITFNSNYPADVSTSPKTKDVIVSLNQDATIHVSQKPTVGTSSDDFEIPAGYTFKGWFTQATGGDKIEFKGDTGVTAPTNVSSLSAVYAQWDKELTVTFHENYGQTENTTNKTISAGSSLKSSDIPTFTRADYAFKEWNTKADGSGTTYSNTQLQAETISSNTDYYAMWTPENPDNAVTLTFSPTGCDAQVTPASMTVVKGDTVYAYQMPTPTKTSATGDAYTFNGWYGAASESDTTDKAPFTLTDNKTVYAHWTYAGRDQVTVTFDYDGATSPTAPTTITVGKGDSIGDAMPTTPVKTNYSFDKWVNTADNSDFDKTTTVNSNITVKATYKSDITVNFNINDGTTPATPFATDKGAPSKSYAAPSDPKRANYTFVGWNTKANGSGKFITAADYATLNDVSTAAGGTNPVELYAYWADAPVTPGKLPGNETPNDNGVKVTFDSNVTGNKTNAAVTDANPKYVYPYLGDALGNMMPNEPTRTHYVFKGWNTKADGSGVTVDSTTKIDQATLKDALKEIAGTNTAYETTLYAQWDIDPSVPTSDKVNVTFNKNLDLNGNDTSPRVVTLYKGDSIGYDITEPTNGTFEFDGWKTAFDGTGTKFDKDTKIDADKTYYATWFKYLKIELVNANAEYTGQVISPKYNIYQIKYDDASKTTYTKVADSDIAKDATLPAGFTATVTDKNNAATTIQNVGVYTIAISIDNAGTYANGYKIGVQDSTFEVTSAKLTVNVDPDTQKQKAGSSRKDPVVTVVDATGNTVGKSEYDIKYYTWTDAGATPDGNIQKSELSEVTDITKVGKYVVAVELKANSNYVIDSVKSTTTEAVLLYDGKTTGYAEYTDAKVGGNIVYEVLANDPSIKEIKANSVKGSTVDSTALPFKDSKYENDVAFDNAETPAIKDYYVRVPDVDADSIQFNVTLTNPDTTTITASDGTTLTPTKNGDGTYTIKAPLTNKGQTENTITITTKAGTDNDAPTLTYTFHVKQLVEAKITLNYGNSPVGEIMKADNISVSDKLEAINKFSEKNTFKNLDSKYIPTKANIKNAYTLNAWNGETDSDKNMDRNPYAIFVYEQSEFKDTGFEAYDSLGNKVSDSEVTRTIKVSRYKTANGINAAVADETKVYGKNATDTDLAAITANDAVLTGITSKGLQFIRPDVYTMTYEFTDFDGQKVTETRNIVVLPLLGDTNIDGSRNTNDITFVKLQAQGSDVVNSTVPTSAANLFIWRVFDGNFDTAINSNDITYVKLSAQGKYLDPFYNEIK